VTLFTAPAVARAYGRVMKRFSIVAIAASVMLASATATAGTASAAGTWTWPVVGVVIRGFDPPDTPYGPGHRGIDIAAPIGTPVQAAEAGIVTFAGQVGGHLFVTIDHGGGLESTYSFVSEVLVSKNDVVSQGDVIALSGPGHPDVFPSHLHFGVKLNDVYVDPLDYLSPGTVVGLIRLAPLVGT
jgi:murein DD-endopeptidase MepM/ murein hydrolase activator NlpD